MAKFAPIAFPKLSLPLASARRLADQFDIVFNLNFVFSTVDRGVRGDRSLRSDRELSSADSAIEASERGENTPLGAPLI